MRVLLLLAVLPLAWAQFPAVCNTPDSLRDRRCCPDDCSSRGTCTDISAEVISSWSNANSSIAALVGNMMPRDVRYQWPLQVFNKVCRCNVGWGGYDCSECDFGFIANGAGECVSNTNQLLVRRNFRNLGDPEQREYFDVLKAAKTELEEHKKWAVVISEPNGLSGSFTLQNVSTYDMFVVHHFLAAREQGNKDCDCGPERNIDFAHMGSAFATWHRYYLLIVEKELRRVAQRIGIQNFTLAYWDWTPIANSLFTNELFGTPEYCSRPVNVRGDLFDSNMWPVVSDYHLIDPTARCGTVRTLRDIEMDRAANRPLQRGILQFSTTCNDDGLGPDPFLPEDDTINIALRAASYANDLYVDADTGFTKRLEGYLDLCAGQNQMCIENGDANNLHNTVHRFLNGHMKIVPAASNDPIFFLHHANIDRIFEAWLRKFNGNLPAYMPVSAGHPGHNRDDYLVPFFPLKSNNDTYKVSSAFGFMYDSLPWAIDGSTSDVGMCSETCVKTGTLSNDPSVVVCAADSGGGGTDSTTGSTNTPRPNTGGGGTGSTTGSTNTPRPNTGGGGTTTQSAGWSEFRVPLHTIWIAGTCALLIVSKLFT